MLPGVRSVARFGAWGGDRSPRSHPGRRLSSAKSARRSGPRGGLALHVLSTVLGLAFALGQGALSAGQGDVKVPLCAAGHVVPQLYLLGAQKSGTSSLVKDLERSMAGLRGPKIPPRFKRDPLYMKKEVHFFDSAERYDKGPKLYASYFPKCKHNLSLAGQHRSHFRRADGSPGREARPFVCFDATPNYFSQRFAEGQGNNPWDRCAEYMGTSLQTGQVDSLVFLIILRNPIDRFFSAINHFEPGSNKTMLERAQQAVDTCKYQLGDLPKQNVKFRVGNTDTLVAQNARSSQLKEESKTGAGNCWVGDPVLRDGIYVTPLMGWAESFPSATFLITTMSGYQANPNPFLAEVAKSVGLEHRHINRLSKVNSGAKKANAMVDYAGATSLHDANARAVLDAFYSSRNAMFWEELRKLQAQATPRVRFFGQHGSF